MFKRILFLVFFTCVLAHMHLTAFAGGGMYLNEIYGQVVSVQDGHIQIVGESVQYPGEWEEIVLYIGSAAVYDLQTGYSVFEDALYEGLTVRISYDHKYHAHVIWLNAGSHNAAAFSCMVSENIYYSNDECVFLTYDGKYRITLSPSTLVIDPYAGLVSVHDIHPGQEMFIWVDMVTASNPAQVYPEKVVLMY